MALRSYPGFTGLPEVEALAPEQRDALKEEIAFLELQVADSECFLDEVCQVAEWLRALHRAGKESTLGARKSDVEAAIRAIKRQAHGPLRLSAVNRSHMNMLRFLKPETGDMERLGLLQRWLGQQRWGRGSRPQSERSSAVLHLSRVWQKHGLGRPPSTHQSVFERLLSRIFVTALEGARAGDLHNLIYKALSEGCIEEAPGMFTLLPPAPRD